MSRWPTAASGVSDGSSPYFELYGNIEALSSARRWRRSITKETLDDDAIAPFVAQTAVPPIHTHHSKAATFMERKAGGVLGEDPRDDLPESTFGICAAEPIERGSTSSGATRLPRDIDRMLGHAGVGRSIPIRAGARPGHDLAVSRDDNRGIAVALLHQGGCDLRGSARRGFKRGDSISDALVVDPSYRGGVFDRRQSNDRIAHADRGVSQRKSAVAAAAPRSCATMNAGASAGRMPAKVSVADRAKVTAGFANEVDAVNQ